MTTEILYHKLLIFNLVQMKKLLKKQTQSIMKLLMKMRMNYLHQISPVLGISNVIKTQIYQMKKL